jgi:SAM-dependent methyltransferase
MKAIPLDYDENPERFRANVKAVDRYALESDVHETVAERLAVQSSGLILDLGCGEGRFLQPARAKGLYTIAFDYSATMLKTVANPRAQGDARRLPFPNNSFSAVVALYMLYHLPDPWEALAESQRVLHSGGLFVACAPSRFNDPELASVLSPTQHTFDAENGLEMIQDYFQDIQVEKWDAPLVHLPDRKALTLYLKGRQLKAEKIQEAVQHLKTPLTLTKRGALFVGRNIVS